MSNERIEWPEYRLFAEREFERVARIVENQQERIEELEAYNRIEGNNRKWIAAIWGFVAGAVPVIIKILLEMHK